MNTPEPDASFAALKPWLAAAAVQSGVSFDNGMRRCLGRVELYDRIARRFLDTRTDEPRKLQAALDGGDLELLRRLAHDLASTAGTLGADGLSATAHALQVAVDGGASADDLTPLVDLFAREHTVVLTVLASYVRGEVDLTVFASRKA